MTRAGAVTTTRADPAVTPGRQLLEAARGELVTRYGDLGTAPLEPGGLQAGGPQPPGSAFVIAWRGAEAVGCGALRPLAPGTGEIKRVYVAPEARRLGAARSIMAALEGIALEEGFCALRLETGDRQPEAIRLYESLRYGRIPCYPPHDADPHSVCFEKALAPEP